MNSTSVYRELENILRDRFDGSLTLLEEVVEISAFRISTLLNEMKTACAQENRADIEQTSHALYSVISLFHDRDFSLKLQSIELKARQGRSILPLAEVSTIETECGQIVAELLQFLQAKKANTQAG